MIVLELRSLTSQEDQSTEPLLCCRKGGSAVNLWLDAISALSWELLSSNMAVYSVLTAINVIQTRPLIF